MNRSIKNIANTTINSFADCKWSWTAMSFSTNVRKRLEGDAEI